VNRGGLPGKRPMRAVDIHAARTQRWRLVCDVARGAEIVIAKAGRPVTWLMPLAEVRF
jgi:antitoxin (DNA-binding transcriptional repressor) of toxin-antitoxin stability system